MVLAADVTNDLLDFNLGPISAHQMLLVVCGLFMIVVFGIAARRITPGAPKKGGPIALIEVGLIWVRDEVVYPWLGPERGRKYLPLLWTMFFFILFSNVFGLLPSPFYPGDHTDALVVATADLAVTGALALMVFILVQVAGMREHGIVKYWATLVPKGVPKPIAPIVFLVEFLGLFTKPFALTVRLFANMLAGHALLAILFGFLIGVEHFAHPQSGILQTVASAGFILFIMLFETLIALIQAYIFTVLSAIFISLSVAHEH
ncbi:MAG TPA: F0F1 ATP synthase subunit A [Actinomycetota bacterium]|nr:F0F1 ATP synthase subunit A [Actinomycetota bacterium]